MREIAGSPRVLLRRLRELMAEALEPQARLDRIVREIASNMVAEVCSLYVLRADSVLELYATEGLNPGSVHLAQLRLGQGLVGTIAASARPLNLQDAQKHPAFAYLPETGEEIYHSFLGVPVLRAGRTLGVLVVQNKTMRNYGDDEVEALETTAMVIAEMIATGDLRRLTRPGMELDLSRPVTIEGVPFNEGVGLGHVVLHEPPISNCASSRTRWARCACRSTTCCRAARSPPRANTAPCSRPTACSRTTAAGCAGWRKPCITGSRRKPRSRRSRATCARA